MAQKGSFQLKIISYGLAVLYSTSFATYWHSYSFIDFHVHALLLMFLFSVLTVSSIALGNAKEWGRFLTGWTNLIFLFYIFGLYVTFPDVIPISYCFLSIIVFLFLTQRKIKMAFQEKSADNWKSVLVIDDDEALIKTLRPILINAGYSVLTANSGEDGLAIAKNQKPDLVILDVILPGIKGRDVCKKIKEDADTDSIPVVFLTAKDSPDDIQAELDAGAVAHITKPVNPKELLSTIGKHI